MTDESKLIHQRIRRKRGSASQHLCIECGGPAHHWAYQHNDPDVLTDPRGYLYSRNEDCYAPMCRRCHQALDGSHNPAAREASAERMRNMSPESRALAAKNRAWAAGASLEKGRARIVQLSQSDPDFAQKLRDAGAAGGTARAARMAADPELRARMADVARRNAASAAAIRRQCSTCGRVSTPAGIGNHQKGSDCSGWVDL